MFSFVFLKFSEKQNIQKVSSFHFIFHSIFSVTLQVLRSLAAYLHAKNQSDPVILSGDICDQRILQSNWFKAIPVITQEQELPLWYLYSKIDSDINFYLSIFSAKSIDNIFQNKEKTLFWSHFWAYFVIFAQREFFLKHPAKHSCIGPPPFKCKRYRVDWSLNQIL